MPKTTLHLYCVGLVFIAVLISAVHAMPMPRGKGNKGNNSNQSKAPLTGPPPEIFPKSQDAPRPLRINSDIEAPLIDAGIAAALNIENKGPEIFRFTNFEPNPRMHNDAKMQLFGFALEGQGQQDPDHHKGEFCSGGLPCAGWCGTLGDGTVLCSIYELEKGVDKAKLKRFRKELPESASKETKEAVDFYDDLFWKVLPRSVYEENWGSQKKALDEREIRDKKILGEDAAAKLRQREE
ncbi:hypothetical protein BDP27DRAFT_1359811 [Rhodocollybia butyracea]|uniref:Uncharacterized protein n=1 Tax=Rhodocollybia butyracea TaxID=206335 RepID=A0A9P5Q479_9AGAR|nr:hypothetical protein BDP27DRAFT_1359811 [Rhodocollybia butyracea]